MTDLQKQYDELQQRYDELQMIHCDKCNELQNAYTVLTELVKNLYPEYKDYICHFKSEYDYIQANTSGELQNIAIAQLSSLKRVMLCLSRTLPMERGDMAIPFYDGIKIK